MRNLVRLNSIKNKTRLRRGGASDTDAPSRRGAAGPDAAVRGARRGGRAGVQRRHRGARKRRAGLTRRLPGARGGRGRDRGRGARAGSRAGPGRGRRRAGVQRDGRGPRAPRVWREPLPRPRALTCPGPGWAWPGGAYSAPRPGAASRGVPGPGGPPPLRREPPSRGPGLPRRIRPHRPNRRPQRAAGTLGRVRARAAAELRARGWRSRAAAAAETMPRVPAALPRPPPPRAG